MTSLKNFPLIQMRLKRLQKFRQNIYNQMATAKDAVFELMDAALLTRTKTQNKI